MLRGQKFLYTLTGERQRLSKAKTPSLLSTNEFFVVARVDAIHTRQAQTSTSSRLRSDGAALRITEIAAEPRNYQNSAHGISKFTPVDWPQVNISRS
jgi:hypothetical protein